ncbi:MAG: hypothetical protein HC830_08085 [Bacteroidetes bacterium]|nr:hypothetical protein [Bacteroidota bacterium]
MKKVRLFYIPLLIAAICTNSCEKEEKKAEPAIIKLTPTHATAFNNNTGGVELEITGGDKPFHYFWSNGQTTQNISGLYAGEYTVKVIYGKNGQSVTSATVMVEQPSATPLELSFDATHVARYGNPQGKINLTVTGGTPPYSYRWNNGDTVPGLEKLMAGTYSVSVTDNSVPYKILTTGSVALNQPEFVCGTDSITDMDGFKYATVQLGNQCWFASNLNTIHDPSYSDSLVTLEGRYCYSSYCDGKEGAHYTWDAMMAGKSAAPENDPEMEIQGVCPSGWHIPTKGEFDALDSWLKVNGNGGSGTLPAPKVRGASSSSGFNALLIGNFGYSVYLSSSSASFWTSTAYSSDPTQGRMVYFTNDLPLVNKGPRPKNYGLSVRCIKNNN